MYNKKAIIVCFILFTVFLHNLQEVNADVKNNVLDCIENEENCEEQGTETVIDESNNENGQLLEESSVGAPSLAISFLKMIIGLFFVLGLIYLILIFLRKKNKLYKHSQLLENLGGISLGQNKSLQLIRLGSKVYLVGVGERVELMTEVTEKDVIEKLLAENDEEEQYSFIKDVLSGRNNDNEKGQQDNQVVARLQSELQKLRRNRSKMIDNISQRDDEHV